MFAFLPLIIFLTLYLGSGIYFSFIGFDNPLHQISPLVCLLPALFFAFIFNKNKIQHSVDTLIKGMGNKTTLTVCLIFLLAGAFSTVTQSLGSINVIASLTICFLPAQLLLPGMFLISAFIASAIGTSIITPIAVNLAQNGAFDCAVGVGAVIGGSMFGSNLSMISDTTIAATSSQGASVKDKLKLTLKTGSVTGLIILTYLVMISNSTEVVSLSSLNYLSIVKIIPYISLIIIGLFEINTLVTLAVNMVVAGILGIAFFDYSIIDYSHDICRGFNKMNEVMIFILFSSGLSHLMYEYSQKKIDKFTDEVNLTRSQAELMIAGISSMFTILVSSNIVAILLTSNIAKRLAQRYNIAPHRSAYLLEIFTAITKSILPYGSQILLASSIASLSPIAVLTKVYYCFVFAAVAISEIVINGRRHAVVAPQLPQI
ncbi:Na+/H+ antiporter NhaC family protein [Wolbachia endosymbiont of Tribolium confusum]|uniref:Na+/H+ antiporter NhaC family protein n=1 Tax=Wolbachia endosymbiont of Tribolium confusum TaxID=214474 RepID=UPI001CF2A657|nr:sodium:proton antiporter [Wolbachia endosymbiont of Tribolium confusum]